MKFVNRISNAAVNLLAIVSIYMPEIEETSALLLLFRYLSLENIRKVVLTKEPRTKNVCQYLKSMGRKKNAIFKKKRKSSRS